MFHSTDLRGGGGGAARGVECFENVGGTLLSGLVKQVHGWALSLGAWAPRVGLSL